MLALLLACVPRLYTDAPVDSDTGDGAWVAPANTWRLQAPPEGLRAEGWAPGEVPPDFRLPDQHGDPVSLWQFYGNLVLVDVSTMWCSPCRDLGEETEATQAAFPEGFVYLTLLAEDVEGHPPDEADLDLWADTYGITSAPVLSDASKEVATVLVPGAQYPVVMLVGPDLRVIEQITPTTDAAIHAAVEAHLE